MAGTANVGRISVSLDANTIKYINDIKKAQIQTDARLKKMGDSFGKFGKRANASFMQANLGSLAFAAGMTALIKTGTSMISTQMDMIDQLAKTSDALGIQQQKLQALHHEASLAGISSDQLNTGLQRMQKNLGDAALKGGAAADALEKLGINVKDINKLTPDEQMEVLASALTKVENQTVKASLSADLFGRNGVRMLKLLEQMKNNGLDPTVKALEDMGIALSRTDSAKVEEANDALFKSQEVLTGIVNKITVALSPAIKELSNKLTDMAKDSKGFASQIETTLDVLTRGMNIVVGTVRVLYNTFAVAFNGIESTFLALEMTAAGFGMSLAHTIREIPFVFSDMGVAISTTWDKLFASIKLKLYEWAKNVGEILSVVPGFGDISENLIKNSDKAIAEANKAINAAEKKQKKTDDAKLNRQKFFEEERMRLQETYFARQAEITNNMKNNAQGIFSGISQVSSGIYGTASADDPLIPSNNPESTTSDTKSPEQEKMDEELVKTEEHYGSLLMAYKKYDDELDELRDKTAEMQAERLLGDVDNISASLGTQLKAQQTYAKATAAITATLAAVQVWKDDKLSYYEKIPAAISATAAVMQLAGQFHGGEDEVPASMNNKSFMLKAGERVVQPEANKDLTNFLKNTNGVSSSQSDSIRIDAPLNIQGNVTDQKWFQQELYKHRQLISTSINKARREKPSRK